MFDRARVWFHDCRGPVARDALDLPSTTEIVIDGENGMLVADEAEMATAIAQIHSIDPARCRSSAAERYDLSLTAAGYERIYRRAINASSRRAIARLTHSVLDRSEPPAQPTHTRR